MILSIDIGKSYIKMVQTEMNGDKLHILKAGSKFIKTDSKKVPEDISQAQFVAAIGELCTELEIKPRKMKNIISGLTGKETSIKQLTTLEMSDEELGESLEFEAKKHIPLDGTEPILDYHIIGQNKEELDKNDLLLVATTKNYINKHNDILKKSGFKSKTFDADPLALMNCYLYSNELPEEGVDVLINIGDSTTTLMCWGQNHRFFIRELDISGSHFTQAVMNSNELDYEGALSLKHEKGMSSIDSNSDESDSEEAHDPLAIKVEQKTVFSNLVDEMRKTLRYYMKTSNQAYFNKFYIAGGSAQMDGLQSYIAENLNVEVNTLNPFDNTECSLDIENPTQYAVAIGMAIRGLDK
jgi:type IV pilus assembly protein PilM|tara:strand:+ start:309 stop:1370 length:1062 start_codon:yes stop_codon:yes gene_type:complete